MDKVEVNSKGIKNRLKSVKPFKAIAEYIWNGFDAGANSINIIYTLNDIGFVNNLTIIDNGKGIPFDFADTKFKPILSSEKREKESQQSLIHGKNGLGRLTFYHFCESAEWKTAYQNGSAIKEYSIYVDEANIDRYTKTAVCDSLCKTTGTTVSFFNIFGIDEHYIINELTKYLQREFSFFLQINKCFGYEIKINDNPIDHSSLIKDYDELTTTLDGHTFNIEFVRWNQKLNNHSSRYYCSDIKGIFKYSNTTSFNNKGDSFYHSVFISSSYFETFVPCEKGDDEVQHPDMFEIPNERSLTFRKLIKEINAILKEKRAPFIVEFAKKLVEDYEINGVFPKYNKDNKWEALRMNDIKEAVMQLYLVEPKIFTALNLQQKKTLVGFLSLIIDSGNLDDLFSILDGVIELDSTQRECFARQLRTTKMSSIVNTIELISDRFKSVSEFERLVFDPTMYAGEVPHLQKMMEKNYWLIGEQYQLLTAAEPKFEEALRRYNYILRGDTKKHNIEHESKNKEMDLFLIRQGFNGQVENVVLELKHPVNVRLGKKELDQVYEYYQVIRSESMFNASNCTWKFYLIGNKFDSTDYIQGQINNLKDKGEPGLAFSGDYKVYVYTWSEIFHNFKVKHRYLQEKLQLQMNLLNEDNYETADDIANKIRTSDARKELVLP
ncbi:ATP-binding protein [Aeromonas veronii]|uniref:ATP-binding protein n=1 Tax=Aeromonas veronii TaxID=654 RepID=UPI003D1F9BC0